MSDGNSSLRWYSKKLARRACLAAATPLLPRQGVRVLTYHRLTQCSRDPFAVAPDEFVRQMQWLGERDLSVSLDDLLSFLRGERHLRDGSVLVSIDDGFASTYDVLLPVLRRYEIPAVAFIPAGLIDHPPADDPEPRLTWAQLDELAAGGVELGSHGWSHRSFGTMTRDEMVAEAIRSRETLERHCGRPVRAFAYPFGTRADYGPTSTEVLSRSGYECAFTAQHGPVRTGSHRLELPRVKVEGGEGLWAFSQSCQGGLDAWRFVDRWMSAVQARVG